MSRGKISRRTLKRVKVYQGGTISLKSLKTDPFQKSKHFQLKIKYFTCSFCRRVSLRQEAHEEEKVEKEKNEEKEKEKKKESKWLKPKSIIKKYVLPI